MLAADVLVTDYSSMMFDFANTGRPMLFFTYDLDAYRDEIRGFYFDFVEHGARAAAARRPTSSREALQDLDGVRARVRRPLRGVRASVLRARRRPRRRARRGSGAVVRRRAKHTAFRLARKALLRAVRAQPRGGRPRGRRAPRDHHAHDRVGHGRHDPRQPQPRAPPGRGGLRGRAAQRRPHARDGVLRRLPARCPRRGARGPPRRRAAAPAAAPARPPLQRADARRRPDRQGTSACGSTSSSSATCAARQAS